MKNPPPPLPPYPPISQLRMKQPCSSPNLWQHVSQSVRLLPLIPLLSLSENFCHTEKEL